MAHKPDLALERQYSDESRFDMVQKIYQTPYKELSSNEDIREFIENAFSSDLRAVKGALSDLVHNDYYESVQLLENLRKTPEIAESVLESADIQDGRYKRSIQDYIDWGFEGDDHARNEIRGWKGRDHKSKLCYLESLCGRRSMIEDQELKQQMEERLRSEFIASIHEL